MNLESKDMNTERIDQLRNRLPGDRRYLGTIVTSGEHTGIVDAEFIDLQAAVDCGLVDPLWFDEQFPQCKTPRECRWLSVVTESGAVLIGEHDIVSTTP